MNPFQKLRKAVDKCTIVYQLEEQPASKIQMGVPSPSAQVPKSPKAKKQPSTQNPESINTVLIAQQTKHNQQLNQLITRNERLSRQIKMLQVQKQQLIQQVCTLEKNNELLEDKLKQIYSGQGAFDEKDRKYREEIHRINKNLQNLGIELNAQRIAKKNAINQLNKHKQQSQSINNERNKIFDNLSVKIKKLQEQIVERAQMLQYNIKKNSQQRRQNKQLIERMRIDYDHKLQQLNNTILLVSNQLSTYKAQYQILSHKHEGLTSALKSTQQKNQSLQNQIVSHSSASRKLQKQLQQAIQNVKYLNQENMKLQSELTQQKQRVKVKVVEIKDEALELELEMYKKQCKQLLQDRAVYNKINYTRT